MIQNHHAMITPVLDIVKSTDNYIPNGNHSMFQKLWLEETKASLYEALEATEESEKDRQKAYDILHLVSDALSIFTREATNRAWSQLTLEEKQTKVKAIQEAPQIPQRSEEWFKHFGKVLTASEFSALFTNTKRRRDLVMSKVNPNTEITTFQHACPTEGMTALGWGIRFEPVVKQLIEHRDKCKLFEPGRLYHKTNTHLAASPDGVIAEALHVEQLARLVEIKCPYSRTIGGEIPSDYWIQMQIQMEVADIDECEYIEVELLSKRPRQQEEVDLSGTTYQGTVYLLKKQVKEGEPFDYKYVYGEIDSEETPEFPEGYECVETIPWGLKRWHRKIVSRDKVWYESTKSWQEAFWKDVEAVRQGQDIQPPTSKKQDVCLISDD
jgi:putative phage-type endonuclease